MENLLIVKLGGSILTDKTKPFTADMDTINRLAAEIHAARMANKNLKILLGHGGGSFPHVPAKEYRVKDGIISEKSIKGISLVQDAASQLNRIVVRALIDAGENAISVQPSAAAFMKDGKIFKWYVEPIAEMLKHNMLPVFYGDVVLDLDKGCSIASTELLIDYLIQVFRPQRVIVAGNVDGVFTADPHKDKNAKLIPLITPENFCEVKKYLGGAAGIDVTGGMLHKIERLLELAKLGIESEIVNAGRPDCLKRALLGEKGLGTIIHA
ncbi:MAG: isopentenyl phosphate kinase [Candidatus Aenigmatarchaeota archaeon]|nr:isopentenyl phosphate kinase family protein [Candidatus Aenigmarchaeota archaeon]